MYQQITIVGNLGNEPEMRYTPGGDAVTSFRMAVNKSWTGKDGQKQEKVLWFRVTAWRKLGETISQYLHKGSKVLIVGELEESKPYQNSKTGEWVSTPEVTAREVRFLSGKGDSDGEQAQEAPAATTRQEPQTIDPESIPF